MYHNPADFVFEVMAKEREKAPNFFASLWHRKANEGESMSVSERREGGREREPFASDRPSINKERERERELSREMESVDFGYSTSWLRQFYTLMRRSVYMTLMDKQVCVCVCACL